jgi:spore coat polysaccharide biosynthesis protein SpsF (cytidylyltransferase family)
MKIAVETTATMKNTFILIRNIILTIIKQPTCHYVQEFKTLYIPNRPKSWKGCKY